MSMLEKPNILCYRIKRYEYIYSLKTVDRRKDKRILGLTIKVCVYVTKSIKEPLSKLKYEAKNGPII